MSPDSQALSSKAPRKCLRLGPLNYALVPCDSWGEKTVAAINLDIPLLSEWAGDFDRIIHLQRQEPLTKTISPLFPQKQRSIIRAEATDASEWIQQSNSMNAVWFSERGQLSFWTAAADERVAPLRFHLPWSLILHDLSRIGGGLIHGGTAVHNRRAWLFLAPPGGGKSTTLATAPPDWDIPSDDAALIWPTADGDWLVASLPSWSDMISPARPIHRASRWGADPVRLAGILFLNKSRILHYRRLTQTTAAAAVYRALNEYPPLVFAGHLHQKNFFHCAARLAREIPCWGLDLPLGGDLWGELMLLSQG